MMGLLLALSLFSASKTARVVIGNDTLFVEVAVTEEERALGLMYREFLPENGGMLFIFEDEDYLSFWMKNTMIPLSIAFINSDGVIVDIQDMEPFTTTPHVSKKPARFALEVNQGWFKKHGVKVGDRVKFIFD